jgi:hypothetical protein
LTVITYQNRNGSAATEVWRCEECHCFHLLAGQTLLTFTPQEFATLTQDLAECDCVQMPISKDQAAGGQIENKFFDVAGP